MNNNDVTKIPKKTQKIIDSTLSKAFINMMPIQVELLQKMFETVYLEGINTGMEITKGIVDDAFADVKKK